MLFFQLQPLQRYKSLGNTFMYQLKATRHARSQTLFDEIFGNDNKRTEVSEAEPKFAFSETDSLYQVLQFYLGNSGQNPFAADDLTSYGCWCQLRNQAAQGIVQGKLIFFFNF